MCYEELKNKTCHFKILFLLFLKLKKNHEFDISTFLQW